MTLSVHYLCSYYSQWAHTNVAPRSQALWDAYKFARAVKTGSINGYCTLPTNPTPMQINAQNVGEARKLFGAFIRQVLPSDIYDQCAFVPVPSKDSFSESDFRSLTMVREALPPALHPRILPLVRFNAQLLPASEGGGRGYDAVRPHLGVAHATGLPIVLVDDILTTGGTILASRDALVAANCNVVAAVVCGKTTSSTEPAFKMRSVELADHIGFMDLDGLE